MKVRDLARHFIALASLIAAGERAVLADWEVTEINVGITPTCPYGLAGCWAGCAGALKNMSNITSITLAPDTYNCTATVYVENGRLPDPDKWRNDFEKSANQAYGFRGVEVTIKGKARVENKRLVLDSNDSKQRITLAALDHKIQWNFRKGKARQPEPEEKEAFNQLLKLCDKNESTNLLVTGPIRKDRSGYVLEVREYFPISR